MGPITVHFLALFFFNSHQSVSIKSPQSSANSLYLRLENRRRLKLINACRTSPASANNFFPILTDKMLSAPTLHRAQDAYRGKMCANQ